MIPAHKPKNREKAGSFVRGIKAVGNDLIGCLFNNLNFPEREKRISH
jgi:hypothetical protein